MYTCIRIQISANIYNYIALTSGLNISENCCQSSECSASIWWIYVYMHTYTNICKYIQIYSTYLRIEHFGKLLPVESECSASIWWICVYMHTYTNICKYIQIYSTYLRIEHFGKLLPVERVLSINMMNICIHAYVYKYLQIYTTI